MKNPYLLTFLTALVPVLLATSLHGQVVLVQHWAFDGAADTTLSGSTNTGTDGDWAFPANADVDAYVGQNGSGQLLINGGIASSNHNLTTSGTSSYTTGIYEFAFTLAGWHLDEGGVFSWFDFNLLDSAGGQLLQLRVSELGGTVNRHTPRLGITGINADGSDFSENSGPFTGGPISANAAEFQPVRISTILDLDENTVQVNLSQPGTTFPTSSWDLAIPQDALGLGGFNLALRMQSSEHTTNPGTVIGNFYALDDISLIPEPSGFAIMAGLMALGLVYYRRRNR